MLLDPNSQLLYNLINSIDDQKWQQSYNNSLYKTQMGARDKKNQTQQSKPNKIAPSDHSDDDESNQTLPIPAMEQLSLNQKKSGQTDTPNHLPNYDQFSFLKNKPIKKRNKVALVETKDKNKKIEKLERRIQELQKILEDHKNKENACPHCHFYLNQNQVNNQETRTFTPQGEPMVDCFKRSTSRDSLQFEKMDFMTPLMCSPEMQEKSWIFLGTIMIAMGSKVMDMDGTINVFKIVKESVDKIRRQVQKSEQKLSLDFFIGKQQFVPQMRMDELNFDPFYHKEESHTGLALEGVRVESVEEYDLYFDQKLTYNVKYDALITIMEYMKQNSSISFI